MTEAIGIVIWLNIGLIGGVVAYLLYKEGWRFIRKFRRLPSEYYTSDSTSGLALMLCGAAGSIVSLLYYFSTHN